MKERFLPIGTVVRLKGQQRKAMITGYLIYPKGNHKKTIYDYGSCAYPEGIIDTDVSVAFNHEDIEEVVHMGLAGDEYKKINDYLKNSEKDLKEKAKEILK